MDIYQKIVLGTEDHMKEIVFVGLDSWKKTAVADSFAVTFAVSRKTVLTEK